MKEVIDWMKEGSCEHKDLVFVIAIKSYARAGLLDEQSPSKAYLISTA